jgi:alpha-L-rhamnosidase
MRTGLLCLLCAAGLAGATLAPRDLRCEYRVNPEGLDAVAPRLTWTLAPAGPALRGLHQQAYRILAASTEAALRANRGDLWDSGRIASAQSVLVPYAGKPLAPGAAAYWKVQVWDQAGAASDWSAPAHWSRGLDRWTAQWVGQALPPVNPTGSPYADFSAAHWIRAGEAREFHTTFEIPSGRRIARAIAVFAAGAGADVTVNGKPVAAKSSIAIPQVQYVTHLLHPGENAIAVTARPGSADTPEGVVGALRVEFVSGGAIIVPTSAVWTSSAPVVDAGAGPWNTVGITSEHRLAAVMLRKEFAVAKPVRRAMVYYSGLGLSELYLNGAKVGDHVLSPGLTDYDKHVLYETFDVTRSLKPGANTVGLWLGNGRFHAPRIGAAHNTRDFGDPKAILELHIEYADGSTASVATGPAWRATGSGPVLADNEYDGEEYDARRELPLWSTPGFADGFWRPAAVVAAPAGALVPQAAEPLRVVETLRPVSVRKLAPNVYIFDIGQNMVGWARLHVSGPAGTRVVLRFAETLQPDGSLYTENLRAARATDIYTLKGGGPETWEPRFTYHGFRYVEVTGFPGEPDAGAIEGRVVHDDMPRLADFTSSSDILNRIHKNMFWGIRGNYRSIPTDCPQRDERQGWLGDRSQVSRSETYMFDVAAFYTKWMRDLADSQRADGAIPDVSPNYWPIYSDNLTWPGTLLFLPGTLYDQYGDRRPLEQAWPAMNRWLEHIRTYAKDNLMSKDTYGDWCVPPENPRLIHSQDPARITDKTLIGTAYLYKLLTLMSRYARLLDKPTEAAAFDREAAQVESAFQAKFFKPASSIYDNGTQTSSILPLAFGMIPPDYRAPVVKTLTDRIARESDNHVGVGLVGAQWLMRTLSDNGHADLAYTIATQKTYPGWGYMVERGATTIWELWNGDTADPAMNSGNHVMQIGDLAVWMYEYLAGIRSDPDQPGFRHILIRPFPAGDLTFVKASHQTPYGAIVSSWKREGAAFTLDVTIPPNTTATVTLPNGEKHEVESGAYSFQTPLR